jgi:RTX calcium-binding nonapeptide repeat (4 copies)
MRKSLLGPVSAVVGLAMLFAPASSGAAVSCSYSAPDHLLTVTTMKGFGQITRTGDSIAVADFLSAPVGCGGGVPTVSNTDRVFLRHAGEFDSTDLNLSGGPFSPGATLEPDGSSEVEFEFADDGEVEVHGTAGADMFAWGPGDGLNLNFAVNGDQDVDVSPSPFKDGFIVADGGQGNDQILSQPDFTGFGVFSQGGPGNDTLIAPREGGILEGGSGRDTIVGGGLDLISGGPGKDVVRAGNGPDQIGVVDGTKDRVSCGGGHDLVKADRADKLHGCEHIVRAGKGHRSSASAAAATREDYIAHRARSVQACRQAIAEGDRGVCRDF